LKNSSTVRMKTTAPDPPTRKRQHLDLFKDTRETGFYGSVWQEKFLWLPRTDFTR
jgi:hypothetical protein